MTRRKNRPSQVYLIHFDRPIGNPDSPHGTARHYIGTTDNLERRLTEHAKGLYSKCTRIMGAVHEYGVSWQLARTWERPDGDGYEFEQKLKRRKNAAQLCPICRANGGKG